jgi:predicted dehydrogenase
VAVADVDAARAQQVATEHRCAWSTDWREVVSRPDVDTVVVATVNKVLAPVTIAAALAGKHVLCEKPLGRNAGEAQEMVEAARQAGVILKTGFNHRHHPAIWRAHELCAGGAIGPLMFIRAIYGHGGRPGYDKEWRADADLAGGGELLDQGVHIVDLCRWFVAAGPNPPGPPSLPGKGGDAPPSLPSQGREGGWGDERGFTEVFASTATYFWELGYSLTSNTQLEDNAFALLRTADGRVAQFHTSWTQWKNRFSFEVFGRDGCVRVEGLGGSYGVERLEIGRRKPASGAPDVEIEEFPGPDLSWQAEWQEFTSAIHEGRQPLANGEDGLQAMRVIAALYESARTGQVVFLDSSRQ